MNKVLKLGLISLLAIGLIFGAICLWGMHDYVNNSHTEQFVAEAEKTAAKEHEEQAAKEASAVEPAMVERASTETEKELVTTNEVEVAFDTDFTLKTGESICVGQGDISVELLSYEYDEELIWFRYRLTIGNEVYDGEGGGSESVGCTITQEEFTKNRIVYVSRDETKGVTLQLTADTVVPSPLVISGHATDEYVTTKPEYIEAEDFILFLDKDMKVQGDIMKQIEQIFRLVEQETGLKFQNDSVYATYIGHDDQWLYDNAFVGVDPNREKFHIYAVADDKCSPCSLTKAIVLNQTDLNIAAGEGMSVVHELVHSVHSANGVMMDTVMNEGFATYITGRITEKSKEIPFNFDADVNYGYYDVVITPENAEKEFLMEYEDNWNHYLYGYRFMTFLYEVYGEEVFRNILEDSTASAGEFDISISGEAVVPIIKKNTSDTVFEEFAQWLSKNQERFNVY